MTVLKKLLHMFFSSKGEYTPGGLFSIGHFVLLGVTLLGVGYALKHNLHKSHEAIRAIIKKLIIVLTILEIIKIGFNFYIGNGAQIENWLPLYFCTICIYAGWLSCFSNNEHLQHLGDVFLATGSLVGGTCFLCYPSSSILIYPAFHFLTFHSFFYHGCMVFIGILMNKTSLVELKKEDLRPYAKYVISFCLLSLFINLNCDTNFMFISETFPGTILDIPYRILGPIFYPPLAILAQATLPFLVVLWLKQKTCLLDLKMNEM